MSMGTWGGVARMLLAMGLLAVLPAAGAQTVEYFHTDALGTPVAVSNASGSVIERSEYAPYGELLNRPATDGPGFTGHVQDTATGMVYMQQRYYDPGIGRFLSVDPVTADGNTGGNFNRYKYAANNPYKFTDPDGRQEHAAETFSDSIGSWTPGERAPFEAVAVPVTIAAVALTPGVGPPTATGLKIAARNADDVPAASGSLKNRSGDVEGAANAARSNPYPREVSGHANMRLQTRDKAVTKESMEAAAGSGRRTLDPATGKTRHDLPASASPTGRGVTVVTTPGGRVVTVMDKGTKFEPPPPPPPKMP